MGEWVCDQWLIRVQLFGILWTAARQAFSVLHYLWTVIFMSTELVMGSNHLFPVLPPPICAHLPIIRAGSGGSEVKASAHNAGDLDSIPGSVRSSGEGNGNPLQYSCLENTMDRGAWWAIVHGVAKSWTQLGDFTFTSHHQSLFQ